MAHHDSPARGDENTELLKNLRLHRRIAAEVKTEHQLPGPELGTPSWLKNALGREKAQVIAVSEGEGWANWCSSCSSQLCLCTKHRTSPPPFLPSHPYREWLSGPEGRFQSGPGSSSTGAGGYHKTEETLGGRAREEAKIKAKVMNHPLFAEMLASHVGCLRTLTPIDQQHRIDEQLSRSHEVMDKYAGFAFSDNGEEIDCSELDNVMKDYTQKLSNLQQQLGHHVQVHAVDAMRSCREIEDQLFKLSGLVPEEGSGATMSDNDDEEQVKGEPGMSSSGVYADMMPDNVILAYGPYGPLVPTETERSLMERVRRELKLELGEQGYKDKLVEVREEILRKRRAGKLPEGTTNVLKNWWDKHSKWPYPTEEEKELLIQETGLELKQVNNWFINQRKRNWNNPLAVPNEIKNKRKPGF